MWRFICGVTRLRLEIETQGRVPGVAKGGFWCSCCLQLKVLYSTCLLLRRGINENAHALGADDHPAFITSSGSDFMLLYFKYLK